MNQLKEAQEFIKEWGIDSDLYILDQIQHSMNGGDPTDNSMELHAHHQEMLKIVVEAGLNTRHQNQLPEITLDQAQYLAERTDYAFFSVEPEGNEINMADASQFYLAGYDRAMRLLRGLPVCQLPPTDKE